MASSFVLVVLLLENGTLYARLAALLLRAKSLPIDSTGQNYHRPRPRPSGYL